MGNTSGPGAACPGIALHLVLAAVFSVPALANIPDRAIAPSMAAALGGKDVPGPYSVGDFTDVVATTVSQTAFPPRFIMNYATYCWRTSAGSSRLVHTVPEKWIRRRKRRKRKPLRTPR